VDVVAGTGIAGFGAVLATTAVVAVVAD